MDPTLRQQILDSAYRIVRQRELVRTLKEDGKESLAAAAEMLLREYEALQTEQLIRLEGPIAADEDKKAAK